MTQFNAPTYDIQRPTGQCAYTGTPFAVGETYIATLVEMDDEQLAAARAAAAAGKGGAGAAALGFKRLDISIEQWQKGHRPDRLFSHWKSVVRAPNQKKKLFVDDEVLVGLFRRLADATEPDRIAFRYVLMLILMRKRLIKYEGTRKASENGTLHEWWRITQKGEPEPIEVLDPKLDESQIQNVMEQLGEVLDAEV